MRKCFLSILAPSNWPLGDGIGGPEVLVGHFKDKQLCYQACLAIKKMNGQKANGVTVDAETGTKCYCEYHQTGRNSNAAWRNIRLTR